MAKKGPRTSKEFYKLLKDQPGTFSLANGEQVSGTLLSIDKNSGDLIVEREDGMLMLITGLSIEYIEVDRPNEEAQETSPDAGIEQKGETPEELPGL